MDSRDSAGEGRSQDSGSQHSILPVCESLLKEKRAKYRRLEESMLSQAPSGRLCAGAWVLPGSKSPLNHVIFLSEPAIRDRCKVFIVIYSKHLIFPEKDINRIIGKACELNCEESLGLWKVEGKHGSCYPVLEAMLWFSRSETIADLVWKACGSLDSAFKSRASEFHESENAYDIEQKVRKFLVDKGFKSIREIGLSNGRSFLVVLSDDDEGDGAPWKRFPMNIETNDLVTFRCYFSLNGTAISAGKKFINSAKRLLTEINSKFAVGYYNFTESTKQLQFTAKLHYKSLSPSDLAASLKTYYEHTILNYKWTVRALANLHHTTLDANETISEMFEHVLQLSGELQEEFVLREYNCTNLEVNYLEKFQILLERLSQSNIAASYFPPQPCYFLQSTNQLCLKGYRNALTLRDYIARFPMHRDKLCYRIAEMIPVFVDVMVFPTPNMLYCKDTFLPQLIINPEINLHTDKAKFILDIHELILCELVYAEQLISMIDVLNTSGLYLNSDFIVSLSNIQFDLHTLTMGELAGENYLFYRIQTDSLNQRFLLILQLYQSELDHLRNYPNPLIGWTEYSEEQRLDDSTTTSEPVTYSLCEKFNYRFWRGDEYLLSMLKFVIEVESLHAEGKCHWFICPLTLRQDASQERVAIVFPAIRPRFAELLYSFLSESSSPYLAPEVLHYLDTGTPVADLYSADVYSLCRCISEKAQVKDLQFQEVVARGLERDPNRRPALTELRMKIETLVYAKEM